ncbi:hypothetical protein [Streptomyces sp. TS71-3]|uniref:hypothetical protein n=1 Tax=Streptomyces sp. TS71-3 TaxID=2733862 RepID=UPI001BB31EFC|nr:hypothetical protein [Streptomyces sp. TS71-3]
MIGVWARPAATRRSGRGALVLGLVLLIAAHIGGAHHHATFDEPFTVVVACTPQEDGDHATGSVEHGPWHRHTAGAHVDHSMDRPRARDDAPATGGALAGHALPGPWNPGAVAPADRRPRDVTESPPGRSVLALNCVWRQ